VVNKRVNEEDGSPKRFILLLATIKYTQSYCQCFMETYIGDLAKASTNKDYQ
jgi:hypothetical protein